VIVKKVVLVVVAGVAAGAAIARRRQAQRDADELWREATADAAG
jgi:hypothetical protein